MNRCRSPLPTSGRCCLDVVLWCCSAAPFATMQSTSRECCATRVESLTYEAYESQVVPRFEAIDVELRQRWPETGRVVLIHRTGGLALGESSVIAVVSAPHRAEAFEAARFAIDALKLSTPIWKHEVWQDGADWGLAAGAPVDAAAVPTSSGRRHAP